MKPFGKPVLLGLAVASFALVATASFLPTTRLWGLNHLAFFPVPLRLALLGLVAVCFLPPLARILMSGSFQSSHCQFDSASG
jgi:hypothetical protein